MEAKEDARIEVILLGTGTSGQVPSIACLTDPEDQGCRCCKSEDRKDLRRNTSALLRIHHPSNKTSPDAPSTPLHLLIDVGKSFCEAAREFFPKHNIRRLDAVLLTHPHADAINGLDDLRAWTLGGAIQDSIPIYCNEYTHTEISRMYPYLVNSHAKTGGGDVPQFTWNIIRDGISFTLFGVEILPLPVHHGKFFESNSKDKPYICTSYMIAKTIYYVSDVSEIPEETMTKILESHSGRGDGGGGRLNVLIIDTLRLLPHASHFGIAQAIHAAQRLNPIRTYLVGFTHRVTHDCWTYCCQAISQGRRSTDFEDASSSSSSQTNIYPPQARDLVVTEQDSGKSRQRFEVLLEKGVVEDYDRFTGQALRLIEADNPTPPLSNAVALEMPWVRPAFDGLLVHTSLRSSQVTDNFYD
ncbi:uncharacterized protein PGTG_10496 [Puccinia graminis f. sp. tritici CRL 75-36-700-3]|uniref:Metallo-beta-lactamase domain-containing protein n=1 Tax=Puccinia graminis f. sp. tritici (strain CRL 75-36-700-3 / race SCCL) TaxID=418459 RepID=E3KIJ3_PUCGT|nr:uncharacterized protein PGTG_10496 [Puccinia graminis f. sp. tritici CRL 75-36-700-3]EFP84118.1 hypothetical protein PGTG_10496 [Puccinia graminis f. sp. tritici CRL 75-36-700-3]